MSAVESVTTANRRLDVTRSTCLFDGEDEWVVLLAALLDLDLEAWEVRPYRGLEVSELVVAGPLASVDGDELVAVGAQLAECLVDDLGVVGAGELQLVVDQPDHVALLDLEAVRARVAHRVCHLDGLDARRLGLHGSDVLSQVS